MSSEAPCDYCNLIYSHWRPLSTHYAEAHPGTEKAIAAVRWAEEERVNHARGLIWHDYIGWHDPVAIAGKAKLAEDARLRPIREKAWDEGYRAGLEAQRKERARSGWDTNPYKS